MWQEVQLKIPSAWHSGCCRTMDPLLAQWPHISIYMNVSRGNMRNLKACNMWADHGCLVGRVLGGILKGHMPRRYPSLEDPG